MSVYKSKLIPQREILLLSNKLRRSKKRIIFTNGVFDIIHMGHVRYLSKARDLGDILIIGLNTDKSVQRIKGPNRPINPQMDRAGVLSAISFIDYVVYFSEDTPEKLIKLVRPDVLVKGADYKIREIVGSDFVKSYGGDVKRIKLVPGRSTTKVINRMDR
ncbi:MAG: D-glycero-beta-D-manno-heptose 1-phosphate adenylyltransferase [candidate division Zixibacteria bacterium]|nr:D-glycero-beta-D-manno-heptose 1-phosphate adenylyltransferase [candidate division Zixibacteria bacterium]